MKTLLLLATLALVSAASATESPKNPGINGIAPAPDANLYAAIPEPSHAMLLMLGCFGFVARRRR